MAGPLRRAPDDKDHSMLEHLGTAAIGLGIIAGGLWNGYQALQAKRAAKHAGAAAGQAAQNAYPVSNGWGTKVSGDLTYLRETVDRMAGHVAQMDRRQNTAEEHRLQLARSVESAEKHARTAAEQGAAVSAGLAAHLADHAHNDAKEAS